jgi:hypothetical protein
MPAIICRAPDKPLRMFVEAELCARDEAGEVRRRKLAWFPVAKRLDEFIVAESSIPSGDVRLSRPARMDLGGGEPRARRTTWDGKSHALIGLGEAAIRAGLRVRYFAAAALVEALYRGLADNSVGRLIEGLLRADMVVVDELGFAPLDDVGSQLMFRFVAAAYERRSLGIASHWPFEEWGRFLHKHATAVALLDRL